MLSNIIVSVGGLLVANVRNSFGATVVKGISGAYNIDCILLLPFLCAGNAFSTFTSLNVAAGKTDRIRPGLKTINYCLLAYEGIMLPLLLLGASPLLHLFGLEENSVQVISAS